MPVSISDADNICTICTETSNLCRPCQCNMHAKCFINTIITSGSYCQRCQVNMGRINVGLITLVYLLEEHLIRTACDVLFLLPIFLCQGSNIVNIFDIIIWYLIRTPIRYFNVKIQLYAHLSCLIFPIMISYFLMDTQLSNIMYHYLTGMKLITSNIAYLAIIIIHAILFIASNLIVIGIIYTDVGIELELAKKLSNHITIRYQLN